MSVNSVISNDLDCKRTPKISSYISKTLNKIYLEDCVSYLKRTDQKFSLVIADPPYNIGKDFGNSSDEREINEYIDWCKEWIDLCLDKLTDNGIIYIYGFAEILCHVAVKYPINKQRWLVWHYTNKTTPSSRFWQRSHESVLCLWKNKRPHLEINQIREPYTESYKNCIGKERKATIGRFSRGNKKTIYKGHKNGALPRDVLKVSALAGGKGLVERSPIKHPTQKPFELTYKLLKSRINGDGGVVYIPFCGSGSECMVSKVLGIDFVSTEINKQYITGATRWLKDSSIIKKIKLKFSTV